MQTDVWWDDRQPREGHDQNGDVQAEGAAGPGAGEAETGSCVLALHLALWALHLHKLQGSPLKLGSFFAGVGLTCDPGAYNRVMRASFSNERVSQKAYVAAEVQFLMDQSDTVLAYENKGMEEPFGQHPLMALTNSMDRVRQLEVIYGEHRGGRKKKMWGQFSSKHVIT